MRERESETALQQIESLPAETPILQLFAVMTLLGTQLGMLYMETIMGLASAAEYPKTLRLLLKSFQKDLRVYRNLLHFFKV